MKNYEFSPSVLKNAAFWLTDKVDTETSNTAKKLMIDAPEEFEDAFYRDLEFGTGGMRGVMGVGTNRVNKYTFGRNTQGISNYLKKVAGGSPIKAVIAYDCRNQSYDLAKVVAGVFSANGVEVYLFSELRPTPELSFAVRHLACHCGIVLTASHNPPEYNGYKVYWSDGGQMVPPVDKEIIKEINDIHFQDVNFEENNALIHHIDKDIDEVFIKGSVQYGTLQSVRREETKIVFTSLHGTSITVVPEVLKRAGYKNIKIVEEQASPDGNFSTVKSPNPEDPEALTLALKLGEETAADIVIGTDPDCDRLGVAVRDLRGKLVLLNGNQTMVVMTKVLLDKYGRENLTANEFVATTVVSTPMMLKLAEDYGVECKLSLTGFKWIGDLIKRLPERNFIGGGEESFGYMVGDFVRDKDAVTSTLLACEIASLAKAQHSTFYQILIDCYIKYGYYQEKLISITKKGSKGMAEIAQKMSELRGSPLKTIDKSRVIRIEDYAASKAINPITNQNFDITLPKENVLIYYTEDGTKLAARPSGTEPKIKFYISVNCAIRDKSRLEEAEADLAAKIERILHEMQLL